jgi:hypothetical protein
MHTAGQKKATSSPLRDPQEQIKPKQGKRKLETYWLEPAKTKPMIGQALERLPSELTDTCVLW